MRGMATVPKRPASTASSIDRLAAEIAKEGEKRLAKLPPQERAERHKKIMDLAATVRRARRGKP